MHVAASPVWSVDRLEGAQWFVVSRLRLAPKGQLDWCIQAYAVGVTPEVWSAMVVASV